MTVKRKSFSELAVIRKAGLVCIHGGLENGSDGVLTLMKKGVTAVEQVDAGRKAKAAGMAVSDFGCRIRSFEENPGRSRSGAEPRSIEETHERVVQDAGT